MELGKSYKINTYSQRIVIKRQKVVLVLNPHIGTKVRAFTNSIVVASPPTEEGQNIRKNNFNHP